MQYCARFAAIVIVAATSLGAQSKPAAATAQAKPAAKVKISEDKPGLFAKAHIKADSATAIARAALPGASISAAEIEEEDGAFIYSFDMKTPGKKGIDEVHIDAMTGKVLKTAHETPADEKKEAAADKKEKAAAAAKDKGAATAKKPPTV